MLAQLHIENIAVIESSDMAFGDRFNVLTGETGAGKSIVVDAIGAILGQRTSRDLIRTGAKGALVEALFCRLPELDWFRENGVTPDENGELLLRRELAGDGRNVCRVNGQVVTVAQLKALGDQLVNIHGQHDGQQLLDPNCHLSYLDRFGALTDGPLAEFQAAYEAVTALKREMAALQMDESEKARRLDTLQYQIDELEAADLKEGEKEALDQRRDILRNAEKLTSAAAKAHGALSGDEDSSGAVDLLERAESALNGVSRVGGEWQTLWEKASELTYAARDLAELLRDMEGSLDMEAGELDAVETRLDQLYRLGKKYGTSTAEMLEYLEKCRRELDQVQFSADRLEKLAEKLEKAAAEAKDKGLKLRGAREKAARVLEGRIQAELAALDMPKVRFQVSMEEKAGEAGMDATGMDEVCFLMSANLGEDLKPIHKIASGGELARIMLALKNVLAENDDVTTLIFDEVDTGVSGRAAQKVAQKLAQVARRKQVLCVTHLPQLAAMADTHFSVEKGERDGRTYTKVEALELARRKEEVARLTSGEQITAVALESAGELLEAARQYRESEASSR
ncbi:MAG: DNA repair protein RecN [Muribaculaceae bacterium]|nr:DNA repair protein RecN [Muribaculaceae bacterium]